LIPDGVIGIFSST